MACRGRQRVPTGGVVGDDSEDRERCGKAKTLAISDNGVCLGKACDTMHRACMDYGCFQWTVAACAARGPGGTADPPVRRRCRCLSPARAFKCNHP